MHSKAELIFCMERRGVMLLTPHPGRWQRLTGLTVKEVEADRNRAGTEVRDGA